MATMTDAPTDALSEALRHRAKAEWFELERMIGYRDAEHARTSHVEPSLRRKIERSAIALSIAEAMHLSEGQVQLRLSMADTAREKAPNVWQAFAGGLVDLAASGLALRLTPISRGRDDRGSAPP